jgi:hypothetical protein
MGQPAQKLPLTWAYDESARESPTNGWQKGLHQKKTEKEDQSGNSPGNHESARTILSCASRRSQLHLGLNLSFRYHDVFYGILRSFPRLLSVYQDRAFGLWRA